MQAGSERPEFTPPPQPGLMRGIGLAVVAHLFLVAALTWGTRWNRQDTVVAAEAELWSATPREAAPRPAPPPPAPEPPAPAPAPAPRPAPPPPPPPPAPREPDIAAEQEKQRQLAEQKRAQEEAERQKQLAEQKRQEALKKEQQARAAAAAKARQEEQARQLREQLRREQLQRAQELAGATGAPGSQGDAQRATGPSASYAGRLAAIFRRNVVVPGGLAAIPGSPMAVVQVKVSPSGTILSAQLAKSSGDPRWDEAAVRAIQRSERIPPDENGRYVLDFPVQMRPRD